MSSGGSGVRGPGPGINGFTLLEVLLAVGILSIVVAAIYGGFSTMSASVQNAETRRDATDLARTLVAKLSDDITNAYYNPSMPETIFYGKGTDATAEEGLRLDSISLTTLTNWRRPDSKEMNLWEVGYRIEAQPDNTGKLLIRREKRELVKESPPLEGGTDLVVTDRVEALRLRYFNGITWGDEWDSRSRRMLPKAVEIMVTLDDGTSYITSVEVGR